MSEQTDIQVTVAVIETAQPERLMKRLCKHWGHKFPVEVSEQLGSIELPLGICRMTCTDSLKVELHSDAEQMATLQQVVADHLQRMGSAETLVINWH
jgi:hypothetical protein